MFVVTQWIALLALLIVGAPMFVPLGPQCCALILFVSCEPVAGCFEYQDS
jgi:hypothetical protein